MTLQIPAVVYEQMLAHAGEQQPNECVGMLIGTLDGRVQEYVPLVNELASPTRFLTEARSMLAAEKRCRALRLHVLAIVHSHPTSRPVPSRYDVADHYSSTVMSVIISLDGQQPAVLGWWIADGVFREGEIVFGTG